MTGYLFYVFSLSVVSYCWYHAGYGNGLADKAATAELETTDTGGVEQKHP